MGIVAILVTWSTLTSAIIHFNGLIYFSKCTKYHPWVSNNFWKTYSASFFPFKCIRNLIWPFCKNVKGQPRVIIWTNFVILWCLMLYTKFQWYWPFWFSSEEDDFTKYVYFSSTDPILVNFWYPWLRGSIRNYVPHRRERDILFLVQILLASVLSSAWHFLVCMRSHEPVGGF